VSAGTSRRGFLTGLAGSLALGAGAAVVRAPAVEAAVGSDAVAELPVPPGGTIPEGDPRYAYLATRGQNKRFVGTPDSYHQVFTTAQVAEAVAAAVTAGQQIAIRSGGHCLDDLVDNPQVRTVIDMSLMNDVYYNATHGAFVVEAGALLGDAYTKLSLGWNVVLPGGTCPTVGAGGYVAGGGFGALCRRYGMCADHLYGVEVVTVGPDSRVRTILATCNANDPHRDLWWAHTGAGGGSYGVVTRYLFRSPGMDGSTPARTLPPAPGPVLVTTVAWPWATLVRDDFVRLVGNHGAWHAANSAPGTPAASLFSGFALEQRAIGAIALIIEVGTDSGDAAALTSAYLAAVTDGVGAPSSMTQSTMPWLDAARAGLYGGSATANNRSKGKGAYLRKPLTDGQAGLIYDRLSSDTYSGLGAMVLFAYGGAVNSVERTATANPHRDSILLTDLTTYWANPAEDDLHLAWVRDFYAQLYADTGGVPAAGPATDGSYVNYPDVDLADPTLNTSGVAWSTLYYGENYQRLQQIKAIYDPTNFFRHQLSVALPAGMD